MGGAKTDPLPAGEIPIAIRWRLRPSTSIFAPFGESAKRITLVAGIASATLTVGISRQISEPEISNWEEEIQALDSEFSVLRLLLQGIQMDLHPVLADRGQDVQCDGESAAAVV